MDNTTNSGAPQQVPPTNAAANTPTHHAAATDINGDTNGNSESNQNARRWNIVAVPAPAVDEAKANANAQANRFGNGSSSSASSAAAPVSGPPAQGVTNYVVDRIENGKTQRTALSLREITTTIYGVTGGWPRRVGARLFVDPGHPKPIRWIEDTDDLFAWLHTVAPSPGISWGTGDDDFGTTLITQRQLYAHLRATAQNYDAAESLPYWPPVPTVYSSWPMPSAEEIARGVSDDENADAKTLVDEFLAHFNPAEAADVAILRGLFLTQFWGGPASERPMFVVTTADKSEGADSGGREQQAGKTQLVHRVCSFGGYFEPRISKSLFGDDLDKQIAGPVARSKRTFLLDNTEGILSDPRLASYVTAETFSGSAKWEKQAERINLTNWIITTNELSFSPDITTRVIVLRIKHPRELDPEWKSKLIEWIALNRTELVNAAITILRRGPCVPLSELRVAGLSRMPQWDLEVLATHPAAAAALVQRKKDMPLIDTGCDEVDLFKDELFRRYGDQFEVTLSPAAITDVWNVSTGLKYNTVWAMRIIRKHSKRGRLPMLKMKSEVKHGSDWLLTIANFAKKDVHT